MQTNNTAIIEVENLVKRFGTFTANDNLTFKVYAGEIFGFLGANGAGKTTTIRILSGLSKPTEGIVKVVGFDAMKQSESIKKNIGYMSQRFSLYDDLTVIENIRLFGGIYGLSNKEIVRSSSLDVRGDRIERLVTLCKIFKADVFYEGAAGKNYIDCKHFEEHGIRVEFQDYKHPVYNQLYGDFVPYLSVIDLLFNHGPESLSVIANKNFMEDTK